MEDFLFLLFIFFSFIINKIKNKNKNKRITLKKMLEVLYTIDVEGGDTIKII